MSSFTHSSFHVWAAVRRASIRAYVMSFIRTCGFDAWLHPDAGGRACSVANGARAGGRAAVWVVPEGSLPAGRHRVHPGGEGILGIRRVSGRHTVGTIYGQGMHVTPPHTHGSTPCLTPGIWHLHACLRRIHLDAARRPSWCLHLEGLEGPDGPGHA